MVIRAFTTPQSMKVDRMTAVVQALTVTGLVIFMSFSGISDAGSDSDSRNQLPQEGVKMYATSPGHTVFGEYVGAHWCGPCMSSASPSLDNLKTSNPEDFTFVSFFESSSGGWPSDGPINRRSHVMAASSGYPTFSFADQQSGTCYKVGAGGTNYYDPDYSAGGCMDSDVSNYAMTLSAHQSSSDEVTITVDSTYMGPLSSVTVYLYGAVTEKVGGDAYDNGVRPHHNFRDWLLNSGNNGFEQLTLSPNTPVQKTWTMPISLVRAAGGYSQFENFWPVVALMDGPHSSYNNFLSAADLDMVPLVDVGISEFTISNSNGNHGFKQGDTLELTVEITNNGVDTYSDGGQIAIFRMDGSEEIEVSSTGIGNLGTGSTQTFSTSSQTHEIEMVNLGSTSFRARLTGLEGDRVSSNNAMDEFAIHDLPPTPSQPAAVSSTTIDRGSSVQFETNAISNDMVDDTSTMEPIMQYCPTGTGLWDDAWIRDAELLGSGDNARYLHTLDTPLSAQIGDYDLRVKWYDSSGQSSDWLLSENAFRLQNSLPVVLGNGDSEFAGTPTVKVDTDERVSVFGLVKDAETPLSLLQIDSSSSSFMEWDAENWEIVVRFQDVILDSQGNPVPQGIHLTISDGDDTNTGLLMFNVIENGAPRWSPIPTQSFNEGGSTSLGLTSFLSDTNDNGQQVSVAGISLEILSISDNSLVEANIYGQTLNINALDDDGFGMVDIMVRADDGSMVSDTTITFHLLNVNDAPRIDLSGLENLMIKIDEVVEIQILDIITDVDDPDDEIWVTASNIVPGAVLYNPITGLLTVSWEEPGEEVVTVTLEDRHGESSSVEITFDVVDDLPIEWDSDLQVSVDTQEYGTNPTVVISNVGELVLSEISVIWTVCNSITGICHSSGTSYNLGPFIIHPASGEGLGAGDYFTLSVQAVDQDGFDRSTETQYKTFATKPSEVVEEPSDNDQDAPSSSFAVSMATVGIAGFALLACAALALGLAFILRRRAGYDYDHYEDGYSRQPLETIPVSKPPRPPGLTPPPPPMTIPLPPEGLPDGWSMEQWHYYGEEYLSRRK
tara:strand:- start:3342 stop:6524 length:3183 start_codon:yes stop_codon:yes gene_type:complete